MSEFGEELDLHCFSSKDIPFLIDVLITQAIEDNLRTVYIIHGKGLSFKKKITRECLADDSRVECFGDDGANWGCTFAALRIGAPLI